VLVLDEPTTGLDAASEALVMAGLNRLVEGRTTVLITHSRELARTADHVAVMVDGRVAEYGAPEQLLSTDSIFRALMSTEQRRDLEGFDAPALPAALVPDDGKAQHT
jgi:ABC-type multidrug transport system fused ATPase/permease subunit